MKRSLGSAVVVAAALFALTQQASGQLSGIPVYFSPKGGTGFTLSGDVGRGINDDSGKNTAVGARATLGISAIGLSAGIATEMVDGDNPVSYAGSVSLRLLGGALLPVAVSLQAGAGFVSQDFVLTSADILTVPVGLGLGLNIPSTAFLFEPWVAPRLQLNRTTVDDESDTQVGIGFSAGVTLGFAMGLALHAALDWSDIDVGDIGNLSRQPAILGIGLSYTFRLPGLGVPGI